MALNPLAQAKLDKLGFSSLNEYYDSKIWSDFRNAIARNLRKIGKWNCQACKCGGNRFDFHHITYDNFGCFNKAEVLDLKVLCKHCHIDILHGTLMKKRNMTLREATEYVLAGKHLNSLEKSTSVIRRIQG